MNERYELTMERIRSIVTEETVKTKTPIIEHKKIVKKEISEENHTEEKTA